jgi:hypothetical protein
MGDGASSTKSKSHAETELERTIRWRSDELENAGYQAEEASVLARRMDVDLHVAASMLRSGCPNETALKILL